LSVSLSAGFEIRDIAHHSVDGYTESRDEAVGEVYTVYLDSQVLIAFKDV
jgi:hypothetical protein